MFYLLIKKLTFMFLKINYLLKSFCLLIKQKHVKYLYNVLYKLKYK